MAKETFSHIAIHVTDIEKSIDFYVNALGYELNHRAVVGERTPEFAPALGLESIECEIAMLKQGPRPEARVELIKYTDPAPVPRPVTPHHTIGFTHLAYYVDDIDETLERVLAHGGTMRDGASRVVLAGNDGAPVPLVYCEDPSGNPIELIQGQGAFD